MRKEYPVIQKGDIEFLYQAHEELFAYRRRLDGQELLVMNNLSGEPVKLQEPVSVKEFRRLIANYSEREQEEKLHELRPYESIVLLKQ